MIPSSSVSDNQESTQSHKDELLLSISDYISRVDMKKLILGSQRKEVLFILDRMFIGRAINLHLRIYNSTFFDDVCLQSLERKILSDKNT